MANKGKPTLVEAGEFISKPFKQRFKELFRQEGKFSKHLEEVKLKGLKGPGGR